MTREFLLNNRRLRVDIQTNGHADLVKFESAEHEILCDELGAGVFVLRNSDVKYRARVVRQKDRIFVWLAGKNFEFQIPSADEAGTHGGEKSPEVRAPMPGTLIKLLVKEGDAVEEGQVLAVLEAMKMEHQLRAPLAGSVQKVSGTIGAIIDADAVIVTLAAAG
jgi:biotin carboxyl carrier protein